ncbi:MAG: glycosyltransferase [Candidatus Krumholzibacteriia bacterium]
MGVYTVGHDTRRQPDLTIVIPVRNEAAHIRSVLAQIFAQTLAPERYEVLVVDGFSEDGTRSIVREIAIEHPNLYLLDNPQFISGAARNVGVLHAAAPYVLFIDGHCRLESPDLLATSLAAFERGERCLSRPQPLASEGVTAFQTAVALARSSWLGHQVGSQIFSDQDHHCSPLSAGCGYERGFYASLGGIDEAFDAGEDLEFNLRVRDAGVQALHSRLFAVTYMPRGSWWALFRQLYRYGYGRARMARKHPGTTSALAMALGLMSLGFVLLPLAGLAWTPAMHLWLGSLGIYAAVSLAVGSWAARGRGVGIAARVALCFPAIHLGAGLGHLSGLCGGFSWRHTPSRAARQRLAAESARQAREAQAPGNAGDPAR